jgi:hypothetical protein
MAIAKGEDAVSQSRALESRQVVDVLKVVVWAAAAVLPWAAIVIVVRWVGEF